LHKLNVATEQKNELYREAQTGPATRSILMIAHPGHELRVHGWLESVHPIVCVLTDGSGRTNQSRVHSTTRVLQAAGATAGTTYGSMTDQELYAAALDFKHDRFTGYVDELASLLMREEIDCIAGDAAEGYNPAHDICRLIINAAVRLANSVRRQPIKNFDFNLIGPRDECPSTVAAGALFVNLDEQALARKLAAARNYPELQAEVTAALSGAGTAAFQQHPDLRGQAASGFGGTSSEQFAVECLRPVEVDAFAEERPTPFYELYGERQVSAGHYTRVLRYREHMLPLSEAINSHIQKLISA